MNLFPVGFVLELLTLNLRSGDRERASAAARPILMVPGRWGDEPAGLVTISQCPADPAFNCTSSRIQILKRNIRRSIN